MYPAALASNEPENENVAILAKGPSPESLPDSLGVLLSALTTALRDTLSRFETISNQVTEHILSRGDAEDHKLIIVLQDFDRLQQEFAALGDIISHCATVSATGQPTDMDMPLGHAAVANVTLSDLKTRFLRHVKDSELDAVRAVDGSEQEF